MKRFLVLSIAVLTLSLHSYGGDMPPRDFYYASIYAEATEEGGKATVLVPSFEVDEGSKAVTKVTGEGENKLTWKIERKKSRLIVEVSNSADQVISISEVSDGQNLLVRIPSAKAYLSLNHNLQVMKLIRELHREEYSEIIFRKIEMPEFKLSKEDLEALKAELRERYKVGTYLRREQLLPDAYNDKPDTWALIRLNAASYNDAFSVSERIDRILEIPGLSPGMKAFLDGLKLGRSLDEIIENDPLVKGYLKFLRESTDPFNRFNQLVTAAALIREQKQKEDAAVKEEENK